MSEAGCTVPGCCPSQCDAHVGGLQCDLPQGHDGSHYNDDAGTLFRVAQ